MKKIHKTEKKKILIINIIIIIIIIIKIIIIIIIITRSEFSFILFMYKIINWFLVTVTYYICFYAYYNILYTNK